MADETNRKQPESPDAPAAAPTAPVPVPGDPPGTVTAAVLASWAQVHERTVRSACNRGEIPGAERRSGDRGAPKWHIPVEAARAWAAARGTATLTPPPVAAGPDGLDVAALERAVDRARIVELERRVVEAERDALARRVEDLEAELARARHQVSLLAEAVATTGDPTR